MSSSPNVRRSAADPSFGGTISKSACPAGRSSAYLRASRPHSWCHPSIGPGTNRATNPGGLLLRMVSPPACPRGCSACWPRSATGSPTKSQTLCCRCWRACARSAARKARCGWSMGCRSLWHWWCGSPWSRRRAHLAFAEVPHAAPPGRGLGTWPAAGAIGLATSLRASAGGGAGSGAVARQCTRAWPEMVDEREVVWRWSGSAAEGGGGMV